MSAPAVCTISLLLGNAFWTWLHRLGGPGLIIIGITEASVVPLPGSIDLFLIVLVAQRPEDWPYYAFMATLLIAGAFHYPDREFLGALSIGRAMRYFAVGYATHIYGHAIASIFSRYSTPILHAFIALVVLGAILGLIYIKWFRPRKKRQEQLQH